MTSGMTRDQLVSFANSHRDEFEDLLRRFVETPTVSVDPAHLGDIQNCLHLVVETINKFGGRAEVYQAAKGNPTVYGVFDSGNNSPTVLVYNHMDVQRASGGTEPWVSDLFVMVTRGSTYYGSG